MWFFSGRERWVLGEKKGVYLESPSDPNQKWVNDPIVLGSDQPFFKGHGDSR